MQPVLNLLGVRVRIHSNLGGRGKLACSPGHVCCAVLAWYMVHDAELADIMSDEKGTPLKSPLHRLRIQREKKHCQEEVGHTVLFYSWCTLIYKERTRLCT